MATRKVVANRPAKGELTASETRALRMLLDQSAIRDVIELYNYSLDAGKFREFRNIFTSDARADYAGGLLKYSGWQGIMKGMRDNLRTGKISSSNHFITSVSIRVTGDTAKSDTFAVAVGETKGKPDGSGAVVSLGLRYRDEWIRGAKGWRISYRLHTRSWKFETAVAAAAPTSQAKGAASKP